MQCSQQNHLAAELNAAPHIVPDPLRFKETRTSLRCMRERRITAKMGNEREQEQKFDPHCQTPSVST